MKHCLILLMYFDVASFAVTILEFWRLFKKITFGGKAYFYC